MASSVKLMLMFERSVILLQDFLRTQMTEETTVNNHTDVSSHGGTLPASHQVQNYVSHPESASLIRVWTEDLLEKQADQRTETSNSCRLSKSQAAHTEVVVEVLVHEDPGSAGSTKQ